MNNKRLALCALLLAFFPATLISQDMTGKPVVHQVIPRPASARPTGLVSVSTAESGGLHDRAPLRTLPGFQVTKLDGTSTGIASFGQPKHWLLLYRREDCAPCDRMLKTLAESDDALLKSGTQLIIVVADQGNTHNANRLDALRAQFTSLAAATWLEDSSGAAFKALRPRGEPTLYALSGSRVQWTRPGLPSDPLVLSRMAASWVNSQDPLPPTPANPALTATASPATLPAAVATSSPKSRP